MSEESIGYQNYHYLLFENTIITIDKVRTWSMFGGTLNSYSWLLEILFTPSPSRGWTEGLDTLDVGRVVYYSWNAPHRHFKATYKTLGVTLYTISSETSAMTSYILCHSNTLNVPQLHSMSSWYATSDMTVWATLSEISETTSI